MMVLPLPASRTSAAAVDYGPILGRLAGSAFRRRKRLLGTEREFVRVRGIEDVVLHAERFVAERIAEASPVDDGRQTPYRGHPAFTAQHATATCCRKCLETWHSIPRDRALTAADIEWIVGLIRAWLYQQTGQTLPAVPVAVAEPVEASIAAGRHRRNGLRLVSPEDGSPAGAHVLEECRADGDVVRRWLQLELFESD